MKRFEQRLSREPELRRQAESLLEDNSGAPIVESEDAPPPIPTTPIPRRF